MQENNNVFSDAIDQAYFHSREKKTDHILNELTKYGVDTTKKLSVLELGCNHGFISYHITNKTKWIVYGGELEPERLFKYDWIKKKVNLSVVDATEMYFKNETFDIIIFNHVIEHIPNWEKTIPEIHRTLKKNGILYIATPNIHRLYIHPKLLFTCKKKITPEKRIDMHLGFSYKELDALLQPFTLRLNLNKEHLIANLPCILRPIAKVLPSCVFRRFAQTNVCIAKK